MPRKKMRRGKFSSIPVAGNMAGKRFASSYLEEQEKMHRRNEEENKKWEKAKKEWKKNKGQKIA